MLKARAEFQSEKILAMAPQESSIETAAVLSCALTVNIEIVKPANGTLRYGIVEQDEAVPETVVKTHGENLSRPLTVGLLDCLACPCGFLGIKPQEIK